MLSKPFAPAVLVFASVTAAAGGAYIAVRQNGPSPAPVAQQAATAPIPEPVQPANPAVQETEAVVTPPASQPPLENSEARATSGSAAPEASAVRPRQLRPAKAATSRPAVRPVRPATVPEPASAAVNTAVPAPTGEPASVAPGTDPSPVPDASPVEAARPEPPPAPPVRLFDELVIPSASVIGLQIETPVSSDRARIEDRVEARVLRDVAVDGRTAIPAGARAIGAVTLVDRGGKVKERARLGVRFHTLVLADGTELPMRTDTILREGDSPTGESARKIGGAAVGGAILGAIIGGKKGAIVGGATGAAGGSAVVMAGDRNAATLPVGAVVTVRLGAPISVEVERH
jgi:hypothetical protein